jgi:hypothetical protein
MAEFPDQAQAQSPLTGSENILAAKAAASGAVMIYITPAQLKEFIGTGVPVNFFDGTNKIDVAFMPKQRMSQTQFYQPVVNNVRGDIEHNMDWFNAAVRAVGSAEGWGSGIPSTPLTAPVLTLGTRTENSIAFSWVSVPNAASYNIYKNDVLIANVNSLGYTSTGLTANTSYSYFARAVPASGSGYAISQASNTLTASTTAATGLPTPTAPTVVFNSTARTESATHSNYPNGLEKRYNGGAWENWPDTGSVYVGTDAVAPNVYEWRVKAVSGVNLSGVIAGNAAISASVVVTPGLTNVATPAAGALNKFTFDASTATFTRSDTAAGAAPYSLLKERVLINSSTNAIIQWDEPATGGGQSLVLHTSSAYTNTPYIYFNRNPANPKVEAFVNINGGQWVTVEGYSEGAIKMRLVILGLQITPQYSSDGGTTWIGSQSVTLPTGITLWAQVAEGANGTTMGNVKQSGYSIA